MISWDNHDQITVKGYYRAPVTVSLKLFLKQTDTAVRILSKAQSRLGDEPGQPTRSEWAAAKWMRACFPMLELNDAMAFYRERRPLFNAPPDPTRVVYCRRCGMPLSNRISKAFGMGPICRDPNSRHSLLAFDGGTR